METQIKTTISLHTYQKILKIVMIPNSDEASIIALVWTKLVNVMELQLSYFKS